MTSHRGARIPIAREATNETLMKPLPDWRDIEWRLAGYQPQLPGSPLKGPTISGVIQPP